MANKIQTEAEALRVQIAEAQAKLEKLEAQERLADIEDIKAKMKRWRPTRRELSSVSDYLFDGTRQRRKKVAVE